MTKPTAPRGWLDPQGVEHRAVSVGDLGRCWLLICKCGARIECQDSVTALSEHLAQVGAR